MSLPTVSNQNSGELVVAANGAVSVAPFGTALPSDEITALPSDFQSVGYTSETGVTFTNTPTVADVLAWQVMTPIRKLVTARAMTAACVLQQWNQDTFALAFGGGTWTMVSPGSYRYDPPNDGDALPDYSVVIDAIDGVKNLRWVIKRCNVTDAVTSNLLRTAAATLPVTFTALTPDGQLTPWYFLSNASEFSLAS
jgi:hypothetical protein